MFVAVFVAETYPLPDALRARLWGLEVAIAGVFLVESLLRLYGAEDRVAEAANPYTVADLLAILPTLLVVLLPGAATVANAGFLRALRVVRVLRFYRFTQDAGFFFGTISDNPCER